MRAEAAILTILLPIRMVLKNFVFLSSRESTSLALFDPSSAKDFILILLSEVKAVSADEKKAERNKSTNRTINRVVSDESKKDHTPLNVLMK